MYALCGYLWSTHTKWLWTTTVNTVTIYDVHKWLLHHNYTQLGHPRFVGIPTNISASAGDNVTVTCSAFAVPEAEITWTHTSVSGVERSLAARTNVQISGNTITIFNVEYFQDGGKYTCTASNIHGSITTDAHLNLDCEFSLYRFMCIVNYHISSIHTTFSISTPVQYYLNTDNIDIVVT